MVMDAILATAGWAEDPSTLDPAGILVCLLVGLALPMFPIVLWFFAYREMLGRGRITLASIVTLLAATGAGLALFLCAVLWGTAR